MPAKNAITLANSLVICRGTWKSSTLLELTNEGVAENQKNVFYYDYLSFTPFVLAYDMILANTASSFPKCYKNLTGHRMPEAVRRISFTRTNLQKYRRGTSAFFANDES